MIAADLGADVIKVEPPGGDPVRAMGPPDLDGVATYFLAINRNRRSIEIDLTTAAGRELVGRLASEADAVVENFLPAQSAALGIDELRATLDDVVWVTVAPASSGGPLAAKPAFDLLAQAQSGLMGVTGTPETGPLKAGAPIADVVTGLYAAIGLLAGLYQRRTDPARPARRIEAPLLESMLSALVNQASGYLGTGAVPRLLGNDHPSIAPYAPYATADLDLLLAVGTERQWRALVEVLASPSLRVDDERFATNALRVEHRGALRAVLEEILTTRPSAAWLHDLDAKGVPCAPVNDVPAAFAQPQIADGDLVVDVELSSGTVTGHVASPLRLDGQRPPVRRRPPVLDEHGDEIRAVFR
jgi:crotonobetainyl-CoA:carnitine CoA-transferase CaiB-like acyl-CoA transferase